MLRFKNAVVGSIVKCTKKSIIGKIVWISISNSKKLACLQKEDGSSAIVPFDSCELYRIRISNKYYNIYGEEIPHKYIWK